MVDLKILTFFLYKPNVVPNLLATLGFLDLHPQWFETDLGNSSHSDLVLKGHSQTSLLTRQDMVDGW